VRPLTGLLRADVVEPADHLEVLEPGEVLVDGRVLAGQADDLPDLLRPGEDVDVAHPDPAGVGAQQRGEDAHTRGLASPVGAEQAEHGALRHPQVDTVEGPHGPVRLHQCFGHDGVGHGDYRSQIHRQKDRPR
jgi:hypothetical protein